MGTDNNDYQNLTEFLLGPLRIRPAMYLGKATISSLAIFVGGYMVGFRNGKDSDSPFDDFFGENGFLEWFFKKYEIESPSFWETPFLDKVNQDQEAALELFFTYLEEYSKERHAS